MSRWLLAKEQPMEYSFCLILVPPALRPPEGLNHAAVQRTSNLSCLGLSLRRSSETSDPSITQPGAPTPQIQSTNLRSKVCHHQPAPAAE